MSSPSSKGVALITGGARGLGREVALRLAEDGFDIAINDLPGTKELDDVAKEVESRGRRSHICAGDVSVEQDVIDMIKSTVDALGSLDVMVANAAVLLLEQLLETSVEAFDRTFAVNVRGVMLCYKHAGKQMVTQGRGGRIIGASSLAGKQGFGILFSYGMSKFAVRGMTQSAASELGKYGITVNAYAPGLADTRMLTMLDEFYNDIGGQGVFHDQFVATTPLGRNAAPKDVSSLVSFLASKDSAFITGETINVNGGGHFD
ncbi:NAD-binding protein [Artomyces pyxidatus]|uniref:NAD-binding protein n=1 Tax=Artomyces pyxidatus TaxID=48021 RepID=A0ACB8TFA0_9AGAM|nr:NAD-binding protein [Artomyces pyxidatus]